MGANARRPEQSYQPSWHSPDNVLMQGARSIYNQIPVNARALVEYSLAGRRAPLTEKDFTPEQLEAARAQFQRQQWADEDEYARNRSLQDSLTLENAPARDPQAALYASPQEIYESLRKRYAEAVGAFERRAAEHRTPVAKYGAGGNIDDAGWGNVLSGLSDPNEQIGTSLGRYNVLNIPQGNMIYDRYDFDRRGTEGNEGFSWNMLAHPVKGIDWALRKYGPEDYMPVQIMLPKRSRK